MIDFREIISSDPEIVSGAVVLKGSRVPIDAIFLNLQDMSLDEVLDNYPTIDRVQAVALLELALQELKKKFPDEPQD